jgi:hypothetical protein
VCFEEIERGRRRRREGCVGSSIFGGLEVMGSALIITL